MAEDSGEKTEEATDKRMREVHSKGQLAKSTDLSAWIGVGAAVIMMPSTIQRASSAGTGQMLALQRVIANPSPELALTTMNADLAGIAGIVTPLLAVSAVAVLVTAIVQGGVHIKKMTGKFDQFNLLNGIKHTFGTQALWNGVKTLLKTAVVSLVLWMVIQNIVPIFETGGGLPLSALMAAASHGIGTLVLAAVAAGLVLAALDVLMVMRRNRKKTRMTKKEVKDENKSTEGDPMVKGQRRQRQLAMSRNRMMSNIADADVVMVNPTHVAVALKYEPGRSAPRVVAKGAGEVARGIREKAEAENVPMVKDIPLARALHAACEIGDEIPVDLYSPVARVLTFVMALKARGSRPTATPHTVPGAPLYVPAPATPVLGGTS